MSTFTIDPKLKSFISVASDSHFPLQNLPYGVFKPASSSSKRIGVAIGNQVLDLSVLEKEGLLPLIDGKTFFSSDSLNSFVEAGYETWQKARKHIVDILKEDSPFLKSHQSLIESALHDQNDVTMCVPFEIGDYTDFYSSEQHATNVGTMFRGKDNALPSNWKHIPIGYHGRASSIVTTKEPIYRPQGQILSQDGNAIFSKTLKLDFELEVAFFIGKSSRQGQSIPIKDAKGHIFGIVLMNDWSARDIQKWEYVPLGPFLAKSFATTISPWVVTLDALEPFKVTGPEKTIPVLEYLQEDNNALTHYDVNLEVKIQSDAMDAPQTICKSNYKYLYWSITQQLAHHTVSGCNVNVGDLMASGTISGPAKDQFGSMLEITWNGETLSLALTSGETRSFIEDNDTIIFSGYAEGNGYRVGFGELENQVLGLTS